MTETTGKVTEEQVSASLSRPEFYCFGCGHPRSFHRKSPENISSAPMGQGMATDCLPIHKKPFSVVGECECRCYMRGYDELRFDVAARGLAEQ